MSGKNLLVLLVICLCALGIFAVTWNNPSPSGIESKGADPSLLVQYVSLATAIISLLAALLGLLNSFRKAKSGAS
jgi:hypothetical protein